VVVGWVVLEDGQPR